MAPLVPLWYSMSRSRTMTATQKARISVSNDAHDGRCDSACCLRPLRLLRSTRRDAPVRLTFGDAREWARNAAAMKAFTSMYAPT